MGVQGQTMVTMEQGASLLRSLEEEAAQPRSVTSDATPSDAAVPDGLPPLPEVALPPCDAKEADFDAPPLPVEDANGDPGEKEEAVPPLPDSPLPPEPETADAPFTSSHPGAAEAAGAGAAYLAAGSSLLHPSPAQVRTH